MTGLTEANLYSFKVSARNVYGASDFSSSVIILSAETPEKPAAPTTLFVGSDIVISWSDPSSGGSPITSYQILIQHADGVSYSEYLETCDGSQPTIIQNEQCIVSSIVLNAEPFNIDWGQSVYAKVSASNTYGSSEFSEPGNGGVILTNPDAPVNLAEDLSGRSQNSIAFTWSQGALNGGASVIDYRIHMDAGLTG